MPRHLNESQRAIAAHDAWALSQGRSKKPNTHVEVAELFNVSSKSVQRAGVVKAHASKKILRAVRDGSIRLGKAVGAIQTAANRMRTSIMNSTSKENRQKAFTIQEKICFKK